MGEVINLNKFRKQKARAEKTQRAAENRAQSGLSKADKRAARDDTARREQLLDGAALEGSAPESMQETVPESVQRSARDSDDRDAQDD